MERIESKQKRVFFGYDRSKDGSFELYDWQAQLIRIIYYLYTEENKSLAKIKTDIEALRAKTPRGSRVWSRQTLLNILTNIHYTGDETYPQIVTQEQFDKVQERIKVGGVNNP